MEMEMEIYSGVMVAAYDVLHQTGENPAKLGTFAAAISEEDDFFGIISPERYDEDFLMNLPTNMNKAIAAYEKKNQCFPETIFFYRSNVGQGQLQSIQQDEVELLKAAIDQNHGGNIKLVFIVIANHLDSSESALAGLQSFFLVNQNMSAGNICIYNLCNSS